MKQRTKRVATVSGVPNEAISARRTLSNEARGRIQAAMVAYSGSDDGKRTLRDLYGIDGLDRVAADAYDPCSTRLAASAWTWTPKSPRRRGRCARWCRRGLPRARQLTIFRFGSVPVRCEGDRGFVQPDVARPINDPLRLRHIAGGKDLDGLRLDASRHADQQSRCDDESRPQIYGEADLSSGAIHRMDTVDNERALTGILRPSVFDTEADHVAADTAVVGVTLDNFDSGRRYLAVLGRLTAVAMGASAAASDHAQISPVQLHPIERL
ncbi:MAG: hypothetical protein HYX56_05400 [Chloroflexi bacterium]|nr:hypothetical protein [Chloroflexota bacterium]